MRENERPWLVERLTELWGDHVVVSRGELRDAAALPALVHERGGIATYRIDGDECELVTLDAFTPGTGIGTELLDAVAERARAAGCRRLWLITTNDNLRALHFYQRRGLRLCAVHRGAVDVARRLKPSIPLVGHDGIPLHDELELELLL